MGITYGILGADGIRRVITASQHHNKKILPEYYELVCAGIKNFELRKNDEDYQVGDTVTFLEFSKEHGYSGRKSRTVTINYVLKDVQQYGLADGYCIFGWVD